MYQYTLCSFCREYVVKEMGCRRMLTRELLEEMQHDSWILGVNMTRLVPSLREPHIFLPAY